MDRNMRYYTNGGCMGYRQEGLLKNLPLRVFVSPNGIANILSLGELVKDHLMDSGKSDNIILTLKTGRPLIFKRSKNELHYHDTVTHREKSTKEVTSPSLLLLNKVVINKRLFTRYKVDMVEMTIRLQEMIGWPST